MSIIKSIFITLQSMFFAMLMHSKDTLYLLLFLFIINIAVGIVTDVQISHNRFDFKKFLRAIYEVAVYVFIICCISIIAYIKKELDIGTYALNVLSWLFIYAYGVNIFKNLAKILPKSVVVKYIYYVLSFEIIKKIPFFGDYQEKQKSEK